MKKNVFAILLLQGLCALFSLSWSFAQSNAPSSKYKIVTYLPTWKGSYPASINNFDLRKVTHICIAFANPDAAGNLIVADNGQAGVATVVNAAHAKGTKVMISIGGWECPITTYSNLLRTKKAAFVATIIKYVADNNLDGVDVDLEGNVVDGSNVTAAEYQAFVVALGDALHGAGKEISAALANWFSQYITTTAMNKFDFINMMAYDLAIAPQNPAGPHSPMSWAQENFNHWRNKGAPASKLVLGVPFYGYAWGSYAANGSSQDYCDIVTKYPGAENSDQQGSGSNAVYYNGIPTIKAKAQYVKSSQMDGIMIWEQTGDCPSGPKSLLDVINDVFDTKVSIEDNTVKNMNFEMFPNPASDQLNVIFELAEKNTANIEVYSVDGTLVYQLPCGTFQGQTKVVVPIKEFSSGLYILKLSTDTDMVVRKFCKK
ncbi:MAG TPA: glycosyl hydrolase family 18 protein [Bacteroidia bacterium]|nr:glycosyl hydrolase family 18 protein [Bacteroidia bacterium]